MHLTEQRVHCPYCDTALTLLVDTSEAQFENSGVQQYVEDCHRCCQPILVTVDQLLTVSVQPEDLS